MVDDEGGGRWSSSSLTEGKLGSSLFLSLLKSALLEAKSKSDLAMASLRSDQGDREKS